MRWRVATLSLAIGWSEYTGGSTGTALAFVSAVLGLRFTAVFSDAFSDSKRLAMQAFGAEVLVEPSENGRITPELIARMKARAYALAKEPGSYYADQFGSPDVRAGYEPMGREIANALGTEIDMIVAAVGTGAALMGSGRRFAGGWCKSSDHCLGTATVCTADDWKGWTAQDRRDWCRVCTAFH